MFDLSGLPALENVWWSRLEPGMVVVDGLRINGYLPNELITYPVLSPALISQLRDRYRLRKDRNLQVLAPGLGSLSPTEVVDRIHGVEGKVRNLNAFRSTVRSLYHDYEVPVGRALDSDLLRPDSLLFPWSRRPTSASLFSHIDQAVRLADVLTRTVESQYRFPPDRPIRIHLVADFSYSMKASGRDAYVSAAVNLFHERLQPLLPMARLYLYAFSDDCRLVEFPFSGKELPRRETSYTSFLRKVLHQADRSIPDVVLLFTDGLPGDFSEAMTHLRTLPKLGIDYIQCVFNIEGDKRRISTDQGIGTLDGYITDQDVEVLELGDEEYCDLLRRIEEDHRILAQAAEGAQIILQVDQALSLVSIEGFDSWFSRDP